MYQLTAIDTATRWALVAIVVGTPDGAVTARFLAEVLRGYGRLGLQVRAVLADNGSEYIASAFTAAVAAKGLSHVRTPAHSPNP